NNFRLFLSFLLLLLSLSWLFLGGDSIAAAFIDRFTVYLMSHARHILSHFRYTLFTRRPSYTHVSSTHVLRKRLCALACKHACPQSLSQHMLRMCMTSGEWLVHSSQMSSCMTRSVRKKPLTFISGFIIKYIYDYTNSNTTSRAPSPFLWPILTILV
ncbi:hypothetical protein SAMN04487934_109109, partial [Eubacterium ruminantium]